MAVIIDQADTPEVKEVLFPPTKGMIDNRAGFHLQQDESVYLLNADVTILGQRGKVPGTFPRGCPETGATELPSMLYNLNLQGYQSSNPRVMIGKWGNLVWTSQDDPTGWTDRSSGISLAAVPYQGALLGNTFFATSCISISTTSEIYSNLFLLRPAGGWAVSETNETQRCLLSFQNRLWRGRDDYLIWSGDNGSPLIGDSINFNDNDKIIALTPVREAEPAILIWKDRSIYILNIYWTTDGYSIESSNNTLDYTQARIRPLVEEVGLVATQAVTWVPGAPGGGDWYFLAPDGIRSLKRSISDVQAGAQLPISTRIQQTIDRINWSYADRSVAGQWQGMAYFGVPVDHASWPNLVIAYDSHRDAFSIRDWSPLSFTVCDFPSKERRLYFVNNSATSENYSGTDIYGNQVYQVNCSASDYGGGTTQFANQPVQYDEISRTLTFDIEPPPAEIRREKRWHSTELQFLSGATNATLSLSYRLNGIQSWTNLATINVPAGGTDYLIRRTYSLEHIDPAYYIQFRLQDTTSYADWQVIHWTAHAYPLNPFE